MAEPDKQKEPAPVLPASYINFDRFEWPFYWISKTNNLYHAALENLLKKEGLDLPQWRVLMMLKDAEARSVSYLAHGTVTKLSTMTRIVYRMEERGLVKTQVSTADSRVTEVVLLEKGHAARLKAWGHADSILSSAFEKVSKRDIAILKKTLAKVERALEQKEVSPAYKSGK